MIGTEKKLNIRQIFTHHFTEFFQQQTVLFDFEFIPFAAHRTDTFAGGGNFFQLGELTEKFTVLFAEVKGH